MPDLGIGPQPADHLAAVRAAAPLVSLAEREDPGAFAALLAESVSDPHTAGLVVYGLVRVAQFALALPAYPPGSPGRLAVLDAMVADLAADDDAPGAGA